MLNRLDAPHPLFEALIANAKTHESGTPEIRDQ